MLAAMALIAVWLRWRSVTQAKSEPYWLRFEDVPADEILVLGLTAPGVGIPFPNETGQL
jgi:hypothetical protein